MTKMYSLRALFRNSFPGHRGRPGKEGGSLPKDASGLPSREEILSEAERDYYYDTKRGTWVEHPSEIYDPKKPKEEYKGDLKLEDLRKMDPETEVYVKFYSGKRGGVASHKIKVKRLLLDNEPKVSSLPTLSKAYPTMDSLVSALRAGKRDAEISAESLINQVISGTRAGVAAGRIDKSKVKEINSLLHTLPSATESLGGESSKNEHLIKRLEIAGNIYELIK